MFLNTTRWGGICAKVRVWYGFGTGRHPRSCFHCISQVSRSWVIFRADTFYESCYIIVVLDSLCAVCELGGGHWTSGANGDPFGIFEMPLLLINTKP